MEKDIEILESFIRLLEIYEDEELKQVLLNLINRVKELEKELQELEFKYQARKDRTDQVIKELKKPKYIIDAKTNKITTLTNDFVSKSKIQEKIEELEKLEKGFNFTGLITECETKIEVLQELLEEE